MLKRLKALVKDVIANPEKYRKGFVVPAATVLYAGSQFAGADSSTAMKVVTFLAAIGVYKIPNS